MQPRAFVVMPFGIRSPGEFGKQQIAGSNEKKIDFDRVYDQLLKPALERAGFEVTRADSASSAGDEDECAQAVRLKLIAQQYDAAQPDP